MTFAPKDADSGEPSKAKFLAMSSKNSGLYSRAFLDIVPVKVCSESSVIHTYALLDSGSDRTFCDERLVK